MFGHVRSRSRATFDEKRQRWISECRRCRVPMMRDEDGTWRETDAPSTGKLVPVDPEPEESASSAASGSEAPLRSAATSDASKGCRPGASKDKEKAGEFSAA
jgi:hypothetical protein